MLFNIKKKNDFCFSTDPNNELILLRGLIILFFFILLNNLLYSQNFDITRLGIREGLSQGLISTMCEDSDGFIWVGTLNGLNRYDGVRFQTYLHSPADPYSPAGNVIKNILEDSKGRIWIGYEGALDCFDRKTGDFITSGHNTMSWV